MTCCRCERDSPKVPAAQRLGNAWLTRPVEDIAGRNGTERLVETSEPTDLVSIDAG